MQEICSDPILNPAPLLSFPATVPVDGDMIQIDVAADSKASNRELVKQAIGFAPSWLLSFSFHLMVLLGLAWFGLNTGLQEGLSISAQAVSHEQLTDDIRVDFSSLAPASAAAAQAAVDVPDTFQQLPRELAETAIELDGRSQVYADWSEVVGNSTLSGVGLDGVAQHLLALEANANEGQNKEANFFGLSARGSRFVFVLDCSGSMNGVRWQVMIHELMKSLRSLDDGSMFLVILYSGRTWAMFDTNQQNTMLVSAHKENLDRFQVWLSRQFPNGPTLPMQAMSIALQMNPDAIFLLSDGEFQDDTLGFLRANNVVRASRGNELRKIPIHTVALDFTLGALTLQQIAKENDGQYRLITTQ